MNYFVAAQRSVDQRWRQPIRAWLTATVLVTGLSSTLYAQPATTTPATRQATPRGLNVPPQLRIAATLTPPQQEQVRKFVEVEVAAMAAGDPAIQTAARRNLVLSSHVLQQNKPAPASPIYQQVYSTALNTALLTQLKHADARIRLNAAVTLSQVAAMMNQGATLQKATLAALADTAEPVVIWGVRAARAIYPYLLETNKPQAAELASTVIRAMRRHPTQAAIAEDTFATLTGSTVTSNATGAGLDAMINLIQARAQIYSKVVPGALPEQDPSFPARPELDAPVITYLMITGWRAMNGDQKSRLGRAMYDLTEQLVRVGPLLPGKVAGAAAPRLDDLMRELRFITSALKVMGGTAAPAITTAATNLEKLATNAPAQPLMEAEVANLEKAMSAASFLAPRPELPADPAAAGTPGVKPLAPGGKPLAPGAKPLAPGAKPLAPGVKPVAPGAVRPSTGPAPRPGVTPATRPGASPAGARPAPATPGARPAGQPPTQPGVRPGTPATPGAAAGSLNK